MKQAEPILVRRAQEGDPEAFSTLVEELWAPLVRLSRSIVGDAEAEDTVQDALVVAWKKLATLRDLTAFSSWLTHIVARRSFRRARRRRFWLPLLDAPEPRTVTSPEGALDVERALRSLAPRQRAVMHLTVVEGMTDREIGALLRISAASVRSHRRRARESLNRLFEEGKTS